MKKIIAAVIVAALMVLCSLSFHFILMDDGVKVLRKAEMGFEYTFVDARGARKYKLLLNPALVRAGLKEALGELDEKLKPE